MCVCIHIYILTSLFVLENRSILDDFRFKLIDYTAIIRQSERFHFIAKEMLKDFLFIVICDSMDECWAAA